MNPESVNRRSHLKEASQRLVNPVKFVVEKATLRLKDGVFDSLGRKRVALFSEKTKRIYLVSRTASKSSDRDCGLFVHGIQLDDIRMPENPLLSIQLPSDPSLVTQSSLYHLRGRLPKEMLELAKDIGIAKIVPISLKM